MKKFNSTYDFSNMTVAIMGDCGIGSVTAEMFAYNGANKILID